MDISIFNVEPCKTILVVVAMKKERWAEQFLSFFLFQSNFIFLFFVCKFISRLATFLFWVTIHLVMDNFSNLTLVVLNPTEFVTMKILT